MLKNKGDEAFAGRDPTTLMNSKPNSGVISKQSFQLEIPEKRGTTPLILEMKLSSVSTPRALSKLEET